MKTREAQELRNDSHYAKKKKEKERENRRVEERYCVCMGRSGMQLGAGAGSLPRLSGESIT